ncbi:MAG: hypothetical protein QOI61_2480 [Actinomycetota bacterium]|jgi:hypothetical protein
MATTTTDIGYRTESPTTARERTLSIVGGLLGLGVFAVGFLRWLSVGEGARERDFSGFALQMPTTAVIGLAVAAGLIALLGATERRAGRGVPSAVPAGLAAASFLLALGIFLGKGQISLDVGDKVGVEIGLIVALVATALETIVLGMGLASRHDDYDEDRSRRR